MFVYRDGVIVERRENQGKTEIEKKRVKSPQDVKSKRYALNVSAHEVSMEDQD